MTRYEAELVVQALAGGDSPREGDTLIYTRQGWRFVPLGRVLRNFFERVSEADDVDDIGLAAEQALEEM